MAAGPDFATGSLGVGSEPTDGCVRFGVHPLEASALRLRLLSEQLYAHPCGDDSAATAYSLACDVLSCAAASCELWRAQLLGNHADRSHGW